MMANAAGPEHSKQLVRKIVEEMLNKGRLDVAPEIFGPDFIDRGHESMGGKACRPDGFAKFVKDVRVGAPDIEATIQAIDRHAPRRAVRHAAVGKSGSA